MGCTNSTESANRAPGFNPPRPIIGPGHLSAQRQVVVAGLPAQRQVVVPGFPPAQRQVVGPGFAPIQRQVVAPNSLSAQRQVIAPGFPPAQRQVVVPGFLPAQRQIVVPGLPPAQRQVVAPGLPSTRRQVGPGPPPAQRPVGHGFPSAQVQGVRQAVMVNGRLMLLAPDGTRTNEVVSGGMWDISRNRNSDIWTLVPVSQQQYESDPPVNWVPFESPQAHLSPTVQARPIEELPYDLKRFESAVMVNGRLMYLGADGRPTNKTVHGTFKFIKRGDIYVIIPIEEEGQAPRGPSASGNFQATSSTAPEVVERHGREDAPQNSKPIVGSSTRPNDRDPVISSPKSDYTNRGLLSTLNPGESSVKRDKRRKRLLIPFNQTEGPLWEELQELSRRSSVSSVSAVEDWDYSELLPPCDPQLCWLTDATSGYPQPPAQPDMRVASAARCADIDNAAIYTDDIRPRQGCTRLLKILQSSDDDFLRCELFPFAITDERQELDKSAGKSIDVSYDALSYTWGPQPASSIIHVNGLPFQVSPTLHDALRRIWLDSDREVILWVDAICINQQDTTERSSQVKLMLDIYRGARSVVVWLGLDENDSQFAMAGIESLDDHQTRHAVMSRSHSSQCLRTLGRLYEAEAVLFQRPWFRRSWVRQEIGVCRTATVLCGTKRVSWYALKRAGMRLTHLYRKLEAESQLHPTPFNKAWIAPLQYLVRGWMFGDNCFTQAGEIHSIWYYHTGGVLDLLLSGLEFDATDPRDKIYCVLGLARVPIKDGPSEHLYINSALDSSLGQVERMGIDYTQSVSEVYQQFAKFLINRDQNLDILCLLSRLRGSTSSDLPSWTPDWRKSSEKGAMDRTFYDFFGMNFSSAGTTLAERQNMDDRGRLAARGFVVDSITQLLPYTITTPLPSSTPGQELADVDQYEPWKHLHRLATAQGGKGPLVPGYTEVGDLVFILHGAKLPFVLRPADGGADSVYSVVGPCWFPGHMHGEDFKGLGAWRQTPLLRLTLV